MAIALLSTSSPHGPVAGAKLALRALSRLLGGALAAQRQRDLDRQAADLLAHSGGRLTDSLEREIARRHLGL